jgi:PAS domain S-box-containing protein
MGNQLGTASILDSLLDSTSFLPHGHCFLWQPEALWLRIISDSLIALAYFSIPVALAFFLYRRRDLAFRWIFVMFGVFILACGTTHVLDVWTIWTPVYWLDGSIRAVTAAASIVTAVSLWPLLPRALALPSPTQLQSANARLAVNATELGYAIDELRRTRDELERRVEERTAELHRANEALTHSEERYRLLVQTLTSVVWATNADGEIIEPQPSWEAYTGQGWEQYRGWGRIEAFHPDDRQAVWDQWRGASAQRSTREFEGRLWHQGSEEHRYVVVRAVPFLNPDASVREWIGTVTDINERRSAEETIRQMNERLEIRVQERTAQLNTLNEALQQEVTERKSAEERFRGLLESAPDAIVIASEGGRIHLVNAQTESLFGYSRDEMIGKPIEILVPERHRERHGAHREAYEQGPRTRPMGPGLDLYGRRKDGSEFPTAISLSPVGQGRDFVIFADIRDITEQRATMDALHRSNEIFRHIVEGAQDYAIFMLDTDGSVVSWNTGAERITGYSASEVVGKHFSLFYSPEDIARGKPQKNLEQAIANGRVEDEGWRVRKDGSRFWDDTVITALYDPKGRLRGFSKVTRDLTERRAVEEKIANLNRDLERHNTQLTSVNHELEAFSYSVSHDLRAPLRAMDGFSGAVLEGYAGRLDAQGRDYLQRIRAASQRMGQLIDDLLRLSRISRSELHCAEINLSELARELIADYRLREPGRAVEVMIEPDMRAQADANLMRIMLDNLLGNAWKFTGRCERARIEFGHMDKDGTIVMFVRDNGVGFDMSYADKLFGAFQRLHGREEFEGTGIGLATVQRIVHRHGGRVWAEAEVERGATFYFVLSQRSEAA